MSWIELLTPRHRVLGLSVDRTPSQKHTHVLHSSWEPCLHSSHFTRRLSTRSSTHDPHLHAKKYKVKVTHPEDIITFWAVEVELVELQGEIEDKIEQCRKRSELSGFRGEVAPNTLVAAPFENADKSVSYFRALVLCNRVWRNQTTDNCLVRYVDYGNVECVSCSELRALPNEPLPNSERSIVDVEFLAVKYRLQGQVGEKYVYWADVEEFKPSGSTAASVVTTTIELTKGSAGYGPITTTVCACCFRNLLSLVTGRA